MSLKRIVIDHSPAMPTMVNIILLKIDICPPKSAPTRSNPKIPIKPQLIAPTIIKTNAVLSINMQILSVFLSMLLFAYPL